ncbi:MAG TPA: hypothetical protein DEP23_06665 [Ruminococcaceae bacterium]|jgi:hypothetical protein|nr:hypothetical protein [Oscillospiraceae bacterium]
MSSEKKLPALVNTYRIRISEDAINIQFGFSDIEGEVENEEDIKIVSDLFLSPLELIPLASHIVTAALKYQNDYGKNIGLNIDESDLEKSKLNEGE